MTRVESFTETFIGKWAATAFIFASKPRVTPATRFFTWLSQVWRSAWAWRRFGGRRSTSSAVPGATTSVSASDGNFRWVVPFGPLTVSAVPSSFTVTPLGTTTVTRSFRAISRHRRGASLRS